jgi:phage tail sheath protein FI
MAKSPSVTLTERDTSAFAVTTSSTVLAIVGYATKGPIATTTLVTSRSDFVEKFGNPSTTSPYASLAAYRAFNQTNQLLFYRVANTTTEGDSEAVQAERLIWSDGTTGDSNKIRVLMDQKGSALNGSYINVSTRTNPISGDSEHDIKFYYGTTLKETFLGASFFAGDTNFFETMINKDSDNGGSAWFSFDVHFYTSGDSIAWIGDGNYFIGQAAATGDADVGDTVPWASGDTWTHGRGDSAASQRYDYRAGQDGIPASGGDTLFTTALATTSQLANTELWDYHLLATPDSSAETVENAAISLCEYRKDCFYIADPPYNKTIANAINWHNGTASQGRTTALNTSYAASYWPWLKDYNSVAGEYVWAPPSVFVAEKLLEVDNNFGPWYAPAGDIRGKISAFDYEGSPSLAERDSMYGDLNALNPIVNFASKGLEIFGQKTLLRATTALNRINVRRMVIYAKKLIKVAMDGLVFEPHNADSWARATNLINSILEPIRQGNGLSDYKVTIDETTNTASLIQQSIMYGVIQLVPVGTIEIIELDIKINAAGTTIE